MQVVCATCAGAGDDARLLMARYKMVIIDEATQATEPSNIIPLVSSANCLCSMAYPPRHVSVKPVCYKLVIVDEATQATEPSSIIFLTSHMLPWCISH